MAAPVIYHVVAVAVFTGQAVTPVEIALGAGARAAAILAVSLGGRPVAALVAVVAVVALFAPLPAALVSLAVTPAVVAALGLFMVATLAAAIRAVGEGHAPGKQGEGQDDGQDSFAFHGCSSGKG